MRIEILKETLKEPGKHISYSAHVSEDLTMKRITLTVRQADANKFFPDGLQFGLEDNASALDAVKAFDEKLRKRCGQFPVKGFESLLQMVYHPHEDRFYKQVAIQAFTASGQFLNIRENARTSLPNDTTIILVPQGGCTTDYEEPIRQKTKQNIDK